MNEDRRRSEWDSGLATGWMDEGVGEWVGSFRVYFQDGQPCPRPCVIPPLEAPLGFPAPPLHPHQGASVQASKVAECLFGPRSGVGIRLGTGGG